MAIAGLAQGPFTPAQLPVLEFWFKADTGALKHDLTPVTTAGDELYVWLDQTSGHNNVTNIGAVSFATNRASGPNGSNYISAYDSSGFVCYSNSANIIATTNWTVFAVVRRGSNPNAGGYWFDCAFNVGAPSVFNGFIAAVSPSDMINYGTQMGPNTLVQGTWYIITSTQGGVRTNGIPYVTQSVGKFGLTNGFCVLDMQDHNTTPARYYLDMVEIIGSSTDLTGTASLTNTETYLKNKYGL